MDLQKLIDAAIETGVPGLAERGVKLAKDLAEFAGMVAANTARAGEVLAAGTREDFDAIHAEALAAANTLDAKLDAAARR